MAARICNYPVWVDLKGKDSVPETVHHVVFRVDPNFNYRLKINTPADVKHMTDGVHVPTPDKNSEEEKSENLKMNKLLVLLGIIDHFNVCTHYSHII